MPTPPKGFDALIFDIDGTLWNASPASAKGWNIGLKKLGINREVSSAQIEKVAGNPFEKCVDILLPGIRANIPKLFNTLNKYETEVVRAEGGEFFDGVLEGIQHLAKRHKIFLVSNCQEWYMGHFLDFSNLRPVLAGFDCHGLSGLPKHDMLRNLKDNHSLSSPVYIGDTAGDETAANRAGMAFIHAAWGFGTPAGTPKAANTFKELLDYLS
ncbi:MAG: HAD family hydrolase [Deltaproteobacteria bacterium]|nr:HAD family hydrolase [Deltaproteobacteria bacterium]